MTPVEFIGYNIIFGKGQEEYNQLPAHLERDTQEMIVTTAWVMNEQEREHFLKTGVIYLQQLTFGNPLQPVKVEVFNPFDVLNSDTVL